MGIPTEGGSLEGISGKPGLNGKQVVNRIALAYGEGPARRLPKDI